VRDFVPRTPLGLAVRIAARVGAAGLTPNSRAVASRFAWPGLARRTTVVYPSLPPSAFETQPGPGLREAWGVPVSALVAGYVGQIAPWKRIHDAIEAFATVARERSDVWLVVVGAPKFRSENLTYLEEMRALAERLGVAGRVRFPGFCEDVRAAYRSLDVLVHPAEREPFGRVIVEAMAQRVPVVAAADGGIPETVTDGESGLLFPVGDVARIAALLGSLLRDPDRRLELGRRGRQRALEAFHMDRMVPVLLAAYTGALSRMDASSTSSPTPNRTC
jgi:glycosyltransferase involved in cell wall biosynthesis